jgi:hypothetical protein
MIGGGMTNIFVGWRVDIEKVGKHGEDFAEPFVNCEFE